MCSYPSRRLINCPGRKVLSTLSKGSRDDKVYKFDFRPNRLPLPNSVLHNRATVRGRVSPPRSLAVCSSEATGLSRGRKASSLTSAIQLPLTFFKRGWGSPTDSHPELTDGGVSRTCVSMGVIAIRGYPFCTVISPLRPMPMPIDAQEPLSASSISLSSTTVLISDELLRLGAMLDEEDNGRVSREELALLNVPKENLLAGCDAGFGGRGKPNAEGGAVVGRQSPDARLSAFIPL